MFLSVPEKGINLTLFLLFPYPLEYNICSGLSFSTRIQSIGASPIFDESRIGFYSNRTNIAPFINSCLPVPIHFTPKDTLSLHGGIQIQTYTLLYKQLKKILFQEFNSSLKRFRRSGVLGTNTSSSKYSGTSGRRIPETEKNTIS